MHQDSSYIDKIEENAKKFICEVYPNISNEENKQYIKSIVGFFKSFISHENRILSFNESNLCVASFNENLCNSKCLAVNSHTIPQNQLNFIKSGQEVLQLINGSLPLIKNGFSHGFDKVNISSASAFYGFCQNCEVVFGNNKMDRFEDINKENIFLFFYRTIGRDLQLFINSKELNCIKFKKVEEIVKSFCIWWKIDSSNLYEKILDFNKNLSFSIPEIQSDLIKYYSAHQNKDGKFCNYGINTLIKNYEIKTYSTNLNGFCLGSLILENKVTISNFNSSEYAPLRTLCIFWIDENKKQKFTIFAHKVYWDLTKKSKIRKLLRMDDEVFADFFMVGLTAPRPNFYVNPNYFEKMKKSLDYIRNNNIKFGYPAKSNIAIKNDCAAILRILNE